MVEAIKVRGPENSERSGWDTCPLASYTDNFYFSWNFYKNNTKLSKKKGLLQPPRPTPKLNNSLLKIGDSNKLDNMPISGSGRDSFAEETTMRSKKRESSISLGIFSC